VSRNSTAAAELVRQIIRHGLEPYLESTRTLVALLNGAGEFVAANPAFRALSNERAGASRIRELVVPSLQEYAETLIQAAHRDRLIARGLLEFGSEKEALRCECLVIPLARGGSLLFAEPVTGAVDLASVQHQLEVELRAVKAALAAKSVELQAVMAQADEMAHTDALTFLPNRRAILAELQRQVEYSGRYGGPLTISMLDLDNFKSVNDRWGHAEGDHVLESVTRELREHIRQPDVIGRYGGDELLVILPSSTAVAGSEQAARLCQRIRSLPLPVGQETIHLTLSVGIAQLRSQGDNWQSLLERADRALYEAKRAGGDQWVILES
jgi:diguanylate cyclase (GGDEF)-like protein